MRERLFELFKNKEHFERVLCFLDYFQERQRVVLKTFKQANYVYIDSEVLRVLLGRTRYSCVLDSLIKEGIIERTEHDWKTRYKRQLHTFKIAPDFDLGDCTPTYKRVKTSLNKARGVKNKVSVYTVDAQAVVDQFDVKFEDGTLLKGSFKEDKFSGRLHNPVSYAKKETRRKLRIDGEKLVELDVKSCHPNILRDIMVKEGVGADYVSYYDSVEDVYSAFGDEGGRYDRKVAKDNFFASTFGTVGSFGHKLFCSKFPKAGLFLTEMKSKRNPNNPSDKIYSNVCRELQIKEVAMFSKVWSELCCYEIKFAPVHDAVLVKASDLGKAMDIMMRVLGSYMSNLRLGVEVYE